MCLFVVLLFFGPRSAIALWWIFDTVRFDVTFSSFWLPFLGFLLAPWTTLMYVLVAPGGVNGLDWLWLGLAVVLDLASYSSGGVYGRRRRRRGRCCGDGSSSPNRTSRPARRSNAEGQAASTLRRRRP